MTPTRATSNRATASATTRDRLLSAAAHLFHQRGINATGVDLVLTQSGVAKGSLYHHFGGKQGLVLAYLERERDNWQAQAVTTDISDGSPAERLHRMFGGIRDSVQAGTFSGCPFTNAVIERPDDADVREAVDDYSDRLRRHIADVVGQDPAAPVVEQIFILYNGALTSVKLTRDAAYLDRACALAQRLVEP